jgi:hypothetical protein
MSSDLTSLVVVKRCFVSAARCSSRRSRAFLKMSRLGELSGDGGGDDRGGSTAFGVAFRCGEDIGVPGAVDDGGGGALGVLL